MKKLTSLVPTLEDTFKQDAANSFNDFIYLFC